MHPTHIAENINKFFEGNAFCVQIKTKTDKIIFIDDLSVHYLCFFDNKIDSVGQSVTYFDLFLGCSVDYYFSIENLR